MAKSPSTGAYYYASGRRVALKPDGNYVVVDGTHLAAAGLTAKERTMLAGNSEPLRDGFSLAARKDLTAATISKLENKGLAQPAFRQAKSLVVVLPEVRVEDSRPEGASMVQSWLDNNQGEAVVVKRQPERVTLRPKSRKVEATLNLANRLHEEVKPQMSAPRIMWITPKLKKG